MAQPNELLHRLAMAERLVATVGDLPSVVVGFDGFVDEMVRVVGERFDPAQFSAVSDIAGFAEMISAAAGRSSLREIVVTDTVCGGCAINLGDGLAALGIAVDAFATLGAPPHAAFTAVTSRFRKVESWGSQPGRTIAFEFNDGKVMFSAVSQLSELTAEKAAELLANGGYAQACRDAGLIALTDWTLFPHMTAVWRALNRDVFARLRHRPVFLIDLVDPTGRSEVDIRVMLSVIRSLESAGPVTLSLNGTEANVVARIAGVVPCTNASPTSAAAQARALRQALGISEVVVHHVALAAAATGDGAWAVSGPFCAKPVKTTGAGDRFNAGYALAQLLNYEPEARLLLGAAASGYFVRNGRSASRNDLVNFLRQTQWSDTP